MADSDVQILRQMFPQIDSDVCQMVLETNQNRLEPAISQLLELSADPNMIDLSNNGALPNPSDAITVEDIDRNIVGDVTGNKPSEDAAQIAADLELARAIELALQLEDQEAQEAGYQQRHSQAAERSTVQQWLGTNQVALPTGRNPNQKSIKEKFAELSEATKQKVSELMAGFKKFGSGNSATSEQQQHKSKYYSSFDAEEATVILPERDGDRYHSEDDLHETAYNYQYQQKSQNTTNPPNIDTRSSNAVSPSVAIVNLIDFDASSTPRNGGSSRQFYTATVSSSSNNDNNNPSFQSNTTFRADGQSTQGLLIDQHPVSPFANARLSNDWSPDRSGIKQNGNSAGEETPLFSASK